MAIIETPDDASIQIRRLDGKLCIAPEWDSQKQRFGYTRILRYAFFDKGGHVAMCKRYRRYAEQIGKLKTLEQKRRENPNVDLLIGAVNIWCWDRDGLGLVQEAKSLGIERILWSRRQSPAVIDAMNNIDGVLTSRYDVYHDCVVAQWYWGDYNNKLPSVWDKRDLFNVLYGTPPMFMFNRQVWGQNKERFAQSYKNICPVVRAVGYAEMKDHRFLTPDRDVQQAEFANGVTVTVDFGDKAYRLGDGSKVEAMGHHVSGI